MPHLSKIFTRLPAGTSCLFSCCLCSCHRLSVKHVLALQVLLNAGADYTATVHGRRPGKDASSEAADILGAQQTRLETGTACNGIAPQAAAACPTASGDAGVPLASITGAAAAAAGPATCATSGAGGAAAPATGTGAAATATHTAGAAALRGDSAAGSRKWSRMWSFGSHRPSMPRRSVYAALIRERGLHLKPWRLVVTGHRRAVAACLRAAAEPHARPYWCCRHWDDSS